MNSKLENYTEFSKVLGSLLRKVNRIDRNEKICHGVSVSQCQIIEILHENDEMSMNQLGNETGLAVSTLTRIVDLLVRDGIVKRSRSKDDRRVVSASLTDYGKELQEKLHLCSMDYSAEILRKIPEKNIEEVINSLKLLNNAVTGNSLQCCKPSDKGE